MSAANSSFAWGWMYLPQVMKSPPSRSASSALRYRSRAAAASRVVTRAAIAKLLAVNGTVVNIGSVAGLVGLRRRFAYCTSKGAVVAMTRQSVDLSSMASVRAAARELNRNLSHIDALLNIAAVFTTRPQKTTDGFELMLATFILVHERGSG